MKKYIAFILTLVCVLGLVACTDETKPNYVEPDFTEQPIITGNSHSDVDSISIQVSGVYTYPDKTTLDVYWHNKTKYSVIFSGTYWIERLENGEWVSWVLSDMTLATEEYELRPNEIKNKSYVAIEIIDISTPGTYRFRAACSVDIGGEKHTDCSLWAEFIIE
ncbi:MAG: hypothetical protein IJA45_08800 [Oscillospiraceae bacterium]|nr:hypothetical protein [Oscillospiraceae bacterium]